MVRRSVRLSGGQASVEALGARFAKVRADLGVAARFPPEVAAAAEQAAAAPHPVDDDLRDLPFLTIDPPGSTDLDQAMHLTRDGDGYRVDYAIADVPGFVVPGGPIDVEARRRGQTLYAPDGRVPLHPPRISEDAASLLPGVDRPAYVWRFALAADGQVRSVDLVHALVRSRDRLDYATVQAAVDAGSDQWSGQAVLLAQIGRLRLQLERARGGASLPLPEQEVEAVDGHYTLTLRPALAAEDWNAQLSLMTGMAAARLMLDAGVGLLRTLPAPEDGALARFRRQAAALGIDWPTGVPYGQFLAGLRRDSPRELALMHEAGSLFRGAGYTPLTPGQHGAAQPVTTHAAVAAPYAHVTAPLRRLVDRFGLVVCHALCQGRPVPDWALAALPELPAAMAASDQLAGQLERRCTDIVEAAVLAHRVGQTFEATVVDVNHTGVKVQLGEPAVLARASGQAALGDRVRVRLVGADVDAGAVQFDLVPGATPGGAAG